jgi:methyl-accepting chemotaxis protein
MNAANFKISTRLTAGFGLVVFLAMGMGAAGSFGLHASGVVTDRMVRQTFAKERLITEWQNGVDLSGVRLMALQQNVGPAEQQSLESGIEESSARIVEIRKQLDAMPKSAAETAIYEEIESKRKGYVTAREAVFTAKKSGNEDESRKLTDAGLKPARAAYLSSLQKLTKYQAEDIASSVVNVAHQFSESQSILGILAGLVLLLSVGVTFWISRSITNPLRQAIRVANAVASGDLTSRVETNGSDEVSELVRALKSMNDSLARIVGEVRSGSHNIATASGQIATGSLELSSRTEQQAGSLEETASTMEELTSTVKQNADNARQANLLTESASELAIRGGMVVSQVVDTMGSINESSKKIADIIGVIDNIAFQTNILALNAAVEAARAGEQGRGFAVVATEVRNLAQRSAAAAKEIKSLIGDSVEKVTIGGQQVHQAGATMDEIVASIKKVNDIVGEISVASQEQTSGIEQISGAINQLDEMTQQNASLVEESLASTQSLEDQARGLVDVVRVFKTDGMRVQTAGPKKSASRATPAATPSTAPRLAAPAKVKRPVSNVKPLKGSGLARLVRFT